MIEHDDNTTAIRAEQAVLGALLADNDGMDRCGDLEANHFYRNDHRLIFAEILRQVSLGRRCDPITLFEVLSTKVEDCLKYLTNLRQSAVSAVNIRRHAEIVLDKAIKRELAALGIEAQGFSSSHESAAVCVDLVASKLEALSARKTASDPVKVGAMMESYLTMLQSRTDGLMKPIPTGYAHVDEILGGGLERGTLTVIAARPSMGKTALGLGLARNVAATGTSLFISMEMSAHQVNDRNVSALGKIPLKWLRMPGENDTGYWDNLSHAVTKAQELNLFIDDQTSLNMVEIRAKARKVKRQAGSLDMIVIDQLSFITGGIGDKSWETIGQYTRACIALAKESDAAVVLLCQLNRECEKRSDQRPVMSDLAMSGSIEQDAANIVFLYQDDIARKLPKHEHRHICELIFAKQRQGEQGVVGLKYVNHLTVFEDLPYPYERKADPEPASKPKQGFS